MEKETEQERIGGGKEDSRTYERHLSYLPAPKNRDNPGEVRIGEDWFPEMCLWVRRD